METKSLTLENLKDAMLKFRAQHGRPLKAIKLSETTLYQMKQMFPSYPSQERASTLYGVPIQIDNDLGLWEYVPVYA